MKRKPPQENDGLGNSQFTQNAGTMYSLASYTDCVGKLKDQMILRCKVGVRQHSMTHHEPGTISGEPFFKLGMTQGEGGNCTCETR